MQLHISEGPGLCAFDSKESALSCLTRRQLCGSRSQATELVDVGIQDVAALAA